MENQEIQEIKTRVDLLLSENKSSYSADEKAENFSFEESIQLTKEQYLEIELGLKQIQKNEVFEATKVLNSLKEL